MSLPELRPAKFIWIFLSIALLIVLFTSATATIALRLPASTADTTRLSLTQGVQKTVLDNGLTVLTKEVHTAPVVTVQVWYRVGSRDEVAGQNGISHQLEHLMFKGTRDRPVQFGRLLDALGSQSNAFTSYDETAYFGTVQRNKLEALLTLEADRMVNTQIEAPQLASEKRVVISELQGYENDPSYRLDRAVMRAAFPNHPYGLPVGGTRADVERFTLEQVQSYYRQHYRPDNAVLVVAGDFATEPTLQRIRELYESITVVGQRPAVAPQVQGAIAPSPQHSTEPIVLQEPGSTPLLQVVYPLPNLLHPDVPALDVMDMILKSGRNSRLYQALVETGMATGVDAAPAALLDPGWYGITITAPAGQSLSAVHQVLQDTLDTLRQQPVSADELSRAKQQLQASLILDHQDITSQAMQLAYDQTIAGDYRFSDRYLEAINRVTPDDIQRVAQTYLDPNRQTSGFFEPALAEGQPDTSTGAGANLAVETFNAGSPVDPEEVARYLPPTTSPTATTPQPLPVEMTLANGIRVLLLADHNTPVVNLSGWVKAGGEFDEDGKAGTANLTASNVMNGTQTKTALQLAQSLEDRGASLSFNATREGVTISGTALSPDLPVLVDTLADVLQRATFPEEQLTLSRQRALTRLRLELDDPRQLGWRIFRQTLYPRNHPFYSLPTEASLNAVTRNDLTEFYRKHYRADTTVLALVGDFEVAALQSLLEQSFGAWETTSRPPEIPFPSVILPRSTTYLQQAIPGKTEAVTVMGYNGISRRDPRFYAVLVMNQLLGGDTLASRLGTEIRDRQGLTYGIYSSFMAGIHPGPFLIMMQTAPNDAKQAIAGTLTLLRQLRDQGVTAAELEAAKRSLTSGYPVELARPDQLASTIAMNAVYGLPLAELQQFPTQIEAISLTQVQQVIQDLIHPNNMVIVTAGPPSVASGL